jgi:hypothetical protein
MTMDLPFLTRSSMPVPGPMVRKVSCCSTIMSSRVEEGFLPPDFEVTPYTVMCGRGKMCFESVGNRRFRILVQCHLNRYSMAETKGEKTRIVSDIVDVVRRAGGAFVKEKEGCWYEVGDVVAREKVGALFRDFLFTRYRSSSKCKVARRQQIRGSSRRSGQAKRVPVDEDDDESCNFDGSYNDDDDHDDDYDALSLTSATSLLKSGCHGFRERRVSFEGRLSLLGTTIISV